jgi:hypothetical protein
LLDKFTYWWSKWFMSHDSPRGDRINIVAYVMPLWSSWRRPANLYQLIYFTIKCSKSAYAYNFVYDVFIVLCCEWLDSQPRYSFAYTCITIIIIIIIAVAV